MRLFYKIETLSSTFQRYLTETNNLITFAMYTVHTGPIRHCFICQKLWNVDAGNVGATGRVVRENSREREVDTDEHHFELSKLT